MGKKHHLSYIVCGVIYYAPHGPFK